MLAIKYVIYMIWISVLSTCYAKSRRHNAKLALASGCIAHNSEECVDSDGRVFNVSATTLIPYNSTCVFPGTDGMIASLRVCRQKGQASIWVDSLGLIHTRKVRGFWSSVWGVVTAPFRAVAYVACKIFCHHHNNNQGNSGGSVPQLPTPPPTPPPNTPPQLTCPQLYGPSEITVEPGKTTAAVSWTNPVATDKEDGRLTVRTHPNNFRSGAEYAEGMYVVSFGAMDSNGLSAQGCALSFRIKVLTCNPPRWPDNGHLECGKYILGSQCTVACDEGYLLDPKYKTTTCIKTSSSTAGWSRPVSDCSAKLCGKQPTIENGIIYCPRNSAGFGVICTADCNEGYRRNGSPFMSCDKSGNWNYPPSCEDIAAPTFDPGSCPNDIQVNIDAANNTAKVVWDIPTGTDNSDQKPHIQERNNHMPGQRFQAGSHLISYSIEDLNRNIGYPCTFVIQVRTVSCQPPSLNVEGAEHMMYDCPNLYRLGATCTLSCKSGYPLGGVNQIQCINAGNSNPPVLDWSWDENELPPFCKVTKCPDLKGPSNGALACSLWDYGNMCQLECQDGFDVPLMRDGLYVCGKSDGQWRPNADVPDCNPIRHAVKMHLTSDLYYYAEKCNSSAANMMQIKTNFVKALNVSKFHEACVGVPECKAKFVNVTCGPVTSRRRRDVDLYRNKRRDGRTAYLVIFDLVLPFNTVSGKKADVVFTDNEAMLNDMVDKIHKDVVSGHFDLPNSETHLEADSFGPGIAELTCPKGTVPKTETGSCAGCPTGQFYSDEADECAVCPVGTYQDNPASLDCKPCPHGTNTTDDGARNISFCLEYCAPGHFSPTGLAPCATCDSTSYQPTEKATSCLPCEAGTRTLVEGAKTKTECKHFDIHSDTTNIIRLKPPSNTTSLTFSVWLMPKRSDEDLIIFKVTSSAETHCLSAIQGKQNLTLNATGYIYDTEARLQPLQWHHLLITASISQQTVEVFMDGKRVLQINSFTITRSLLMTDTDSISLKGSAHWQMKSTLIRQLSMSCLIRVDLICKRRLNASTGQNELDMQMSAYYLLDRVASTDEILRWSSVCEANIQGALSTIDDLAQSQAAKVIIPSMCDAVDECQTSPCGSHRCINQLGTYECFCSGGFTGKRCQNKPNFCLENACAHGSTCLNGNNNYSCSCPYGYNGDHCERKAVDGGWTEWNDWSQCSRTCGGGQAMRSRLCENPPPDPEGQPCDGKFTESRSCNEDKCPECSQLLYAYGVVKSCNETGTGTKCKIACRTGLYFIEEPLPYYECGSMTGYKWNHQTDDNPNARLPACSDLKPPTKLAVTINGKYESVSCSKTSTDSLIAALQTKLSTLDCIKKGVCNADLQPKGCTPHGQNKQPPVSGNKLTVAIYIHSTIKEVPNFNFSSMIGDGGAGAGPDSKLVDLVNHILVMEKSAQQIFNSTVAFFQVMVDGKKQSVAPGAAGTSFIPTVHCPPGSVLFDVFCAECPAGSYSDGDRVYLCPRDQYQDQKGQSFCKQCPQGQTTRGKGSLDISECEDINLIGDDSLDSDKDSSNGAKIAIGVCVSAGLLALTVAAVVLVYRYVINRQNPLCWNNPRPMKCSKPHDDGSVTDQELRYTICPSADSSKNISPESSKGTKSLRDLCETVDGSDSCK